MTTDRPRSLLITAGPTHEPIDAVRYIGNRSSGRVGVALADAADAAGHRVTLLLGPTVLRPTRPGVRVLDFRSVADLERLLEDEFPASDALIMAAAVGDYRPEPLGSGPDPGSASRDRNQTKIKRGKGPITLTLHPTSDLVAACAQRRASDPAAHHNRLIVGFALEPKEGLREAAAAKLARKGLDAIVANPLETMDADSISAELILTDTLAAKTASDPANRRLEASPKPEFAEWLISHVALLLDDIDGEPPQANP